MRHIRVKKTWFLLLVVLLALGCNEEEDIPFDTIDLEMDFVRFDIDQWKISSAIVSDPDADRDQLFKEHLLPHREFIVDWLYNGQDSMVTDSLIKADVIDFFLADPVVAALLDSVNDRFPESYPFEERLLKPLKRFKYYFPDKPLPKFRTFITGYPPSAVQGLDQVQVSGGYFGFGLHYFMGRGFPFYPPDLPVYMRRKMDAEYLETVMMEDLAGKLVPDIPVWDNPRLIDRMIRSGMRLYIMDRLLPNTPDSLKISYSQEHMVWATYWEGRIYAELLPHLYSTDFNIQEEYLADAPFTKKLSRESAPRIGSFCGWMIIRQFMEKNPELSLRELLEMTDYDLIVKKAGYRPEIPTD